MAANASKFNGYREIVDTFLCLSFLILILIIFKFFLLLQRTSICMAAILFMQLPIRGLNLKISLGMQGLLNSAQFNYVEKLVSQLLLRNASRFIITNSLK